MTQALPHPDFAAEQDHLDRTVQSMLQRIEKLEDRDFHAGADEHTSIILADLAGEHAADLSPHVQQPYFGSMNIRIAGQNKTVYIGKHAHGDFEGDCSVIDWKTEVGSLFYSDALSWERQIKRRSKAQTVTGTVHRKRQLDIQAKTLQKITDLYDDQRDVTGGREEVLINRLGEQTTSGLRDIVSTIQPEQNAALRSPVPGYLAVQRGAGSGKTSVLFHRLAWLTSDEREAERARPSQSLILMPNQVLAHYATKVLPSLNLQGANVTTPESWALSFLGVEKLEITDRSQQALLNDTNAQRRKAVWRKARLLGSLKMLKVVEKYLQNKLLTAAQSVSFQSSVTFPAYRDENSKTRPERKAKVALTSEWLLTTLQKIFDLSPTIGYRAALRHAIHRELYYQAQAGNAREETTLRAQLEQELNNLLRRIFTATAPVMEIGRLLSSPEALAVAGRGILSATDLQVLATDPLSGIPRPRRSHVDVTELPLILALHAYQEGIGRKEGKTLAPFDAILLDEGQDYSPALYALLARAARPGHLSTFGDLNQSISGYRGIEKWAELEEVLPGLALHFLPRTYRSTAQISTVANAVAATYSKTPMTEFVERQGREVEMVVTTKEAEAATIAHAVKAMQSRGQTNIAIITRRFAEAERLHEELQLHDVYARPILNEVSRYEGGIVTIPCRLAKGIEFDAVVVAGADARTYDPQPEYERRLLFVTLSRALHEMTCVAVGALHLNLQQVQ